MPMTHPGCIPKSYNSKGTRLLSQLKNMTVMKSPNLPPRSSFSNRTHPTSPDVIFSSPDLSLRSDWDTSSKLSSDHLQFILKIQISNPIQPKPSHTFLNYKKANMSPFTEEIEAIL